MQLFPIYQLSLLGVGEPGVPNRERIIMRPMEELNLGEYLVCLGYLEDDDSLSPIPDNLFYFGDRFVAPPSWIILYTGPGRDIESKIKGEREKAYVFHWEKNHTVFNHPHIVPLLLRVDGLSFTPPVRDIGQATRRSLTHKG